MASPRWLETITKTLRELEPTIPDLPERMTVRMLRMIIENGMAEVDDSDGGASPNLVRWEKSIRVLAFMRNSISALSKMALSTCNSARLCRAVSDGMSVVVVVNSDNNNNNNNNDRSFQTPSEIIDQNNTDTERLSFMLCVWKRVSDELTVLVMDDAFMECMGPEGRVKFAEIISLMQFIVDIGTKHLNSKKSATAATTTTTMHKKKQKLQKMIL